MRNIYDIISEQKIMVDININRYDMHYLIESLDKNYFYVEEGLVDSVKNIGRKVIEFIKKLIAKNKKYN